MSEIKEKKEEKKLTTSGIGSLTRLIPTLLL